MINQIQVASRIPWILEQKGIDIEQLLNIDISRNSSNVKAQLYEAQEIIKFENVKLERYEEPFYDSVGKLVVEYEGVIFLTCVSEKDLEEINFLN